MGLPRLISPIDHFCDVGDLRFERIDGGHVWCQQCLRGWERQQGNQAWRMHPQGYGNWRTLPGNRFAHRLSGEIVEGPPPAGSGAERWGQAKSEPAGVGSPTGSEVSLPRSDVGNDTRL